MMGARSSREKFSIREISDVLFRISSMAGRTLSIVEKSPIA